MKQGVIPCYGPPRMVIVHSPVFLAIEIALVRLKPIIHLRGRTTFVRVGGQSAVRLVRATSVAFVKPREDERLPPK